MIKALVVFAAACAAAPLAAQEPAQPAEAAGQFRVLSYNIRYDNPGDGADVWANRRDAMADYLAEARPDLFGLQEALQRQIEYLAGKLPDYRWYGVGRDDGKLRGEFTPIFYRHERLQPLEQGTFWLSETPDEPGSKSWDTAITRICSWVKFRDQQTEREFYAFCTHFDHRGQQARLESARLLRRKIATIAGDAPVVLLGDFNCTPSSEPYRALTIQDAELPPAFVDAKDATATPHAGPDSTWNGFTRIAPQRRIDFIFVRGFDVAAHRIDDPRVSGRFVSDHLPVVADLRPQSK